MKAVDLYKGTGDLLPSTYFYVHEGSQGRELEKQNSKACVMLAA